MKTEQLTPERIQQLFPGASKSLLAANGQAVAKAASPIDAPADKPRRAIEPNKTEREFERILRAKYPVGVIKWEAYTFRMGSRLSYTPDYSVWTPDTGELIFWEVKGGFIYPKALVKCRAFVQEFPHRLFLAQKIKGEWKIDEFAQRHQPD